MVTKEQIEHVAKLARLDPKGEILTKISDDFNKVVEMVDKLQELDLGEIKTTINTEIKNAFREDICEDSFDRAKILKNAPSQEDGGIHVPQIVE